VVKDKKGEHRKILEFLLSDGFTRARIDGEVRELDEAIDLDKNKRHTIEVVTDRLTIADEDRQRLADSLETALVLGDGVVIVDVAGAEELLFSEHFACPECASTWEKIEPRMFSFIARTGRVRRATALGLKRPSMTT